MSTWKILTEEQFLEAVAQKISLDQEVNLTPPWSYSPDDIVHFAYLQYLDEMEALVNHFAGSLD